MTKAQLRRFAGPDGEYGLAFNPDRLPEPLPAKAGEKNERKFSIRVQKEDLFLLDTLAKRAQTPRSTLINDLIHEILWGMVMSIEELDARVLIASSADRGANYQPFAQSWLQDLFHSEVDSMTRNVLEFADPDRHHDPRQHAYVEQEISEAEGEDEILSIMGHSDLFIALKKLMPESTR